MKKGGLFILIFVLFIISISGCNQRSNVEKFYCGDNVCQTEEDCRCIDCMNNIDCREARAKLINCDDGNKCTEDYYDELNGICVHKGDRPCCGDRICEEGERCDNKTHSTVCVEDCYLSCDAFWIVHKDVDTHENEVSSFTCGNKNCVQIGNNKFEISGNSYVETVIENIGERAIPLITSRFECETKSYGARNDGDELRGVIVKDYFNQGEEMVDWMSGKNVPKNNYVYYRLSFNTDKLKENFTANCVIGLSANPFDDIIEPIFVSFKQA